LKLKKFKTQILVREKKDYFLFVVVEDDEQYIVAFDT